VDALFKTCEQLISIHEVSAGASAVASAGTDTKTTGDVEVTGTTEDVVATETMGAVEVTGTTGEVEVTGMGVCGGDSQETVEG
jgi:hypothetical protein